MNLGKWNPKNLRVSSSEIKKCSKKEQLDPCVSK